MSNLVVLCFHTSDPDEITKACEYWAIDNDSKWLHLVKHLSDRHNTNSALLLKEVKRAVSAFDLSSRCDWCKTPSVISSRSDLGRFQNFSFRQVKSERVHLCPKCDLNWLELLSVQQESQRQKEGAESAALILKLNHEHSKAFKVTLTFIDAVYLYSILETSDIPEYGFEGSKSFSLTGKMSGSALMDQIVIEYLYKKDLIKLSLDTPIDAINRENKKAYVDFIKARWEISNSLNGSSYSDLMMELSEIISHQTPTQEEIAILWEVVALSECQRKLLDVAAHYKFSNYSIGEKTNYALLYVLQDFSIPRVWSIIQSVSKNLAADVQSKRLPAYRVYTNVPNALIRFADWAIEKSWNVYPLSRQNWDTESALTSLFFNRVLKGGKEHFRTLTTKMVKGALVNDS